MLKEILNTSRLKETASALPAFALADMSQVTATNSLLPLEPWEIAIGKAAAAAAITGYYLMTIGAQHHLNEGRTRLQKRAVNLGLALATPAVAFVDYFLIFRAPF
ncbi:hypothetical protein HYS95_00285 [Candidatus Daviesbacteria bacterium]|nr:hypothetical protein [Candidatus Daviesbacteria bacterium]